MKLSRLSIPYRALRNSGSIAFVMILSGGFSFKELNLIALGIIAAGAGLIVLLNLGWAYLVWQNFDFMVEDDSLKLVHGVISKKDRKIPLKRIQNVDIRRNIFQRALGIAQISIETAGGNQTEASLKYLNQDEARNLRDRLQRKEKVSREDEEEDMLYEISDRELAVLSATSVDGRVIMAITAVFGIAPGLIGGMMEQASFNLTAGLSILLVGTIAVTWISSAVSNFLKYWGFKLYDREDSLEYETGLLNRSEGTIPMEKVQKITLEENILKRLAGYATLKIDTAGYSPTKSVQNGPEAAIPLAQRGKVIELAEEIQGVSKPAQQNISQRARTRYFFRYSLASLAATAAVFLTSGEPFTAGATLLILETVSISAAHFKWSRKGFEIGEENVLTMNGFWNHSINFIPYYRVQNLIETTTFFQRRWNLSTLDIDTAGTGNLLNRTAIIDLDSKKAEELKKAVYRRFQDSLK
ncbi:MAG: PH domain-containing protein [Candidatus Nanosalina sp.]